MYTVIENITFVIKCTKTKLVHLDRVQYVIR